MNSLRLQSDMVRKVVDLTAAHLASMADLHAQAFSKNWSAAELARMMEGPCAFSLGIGEIDAIEGFVIARAIAGEAEVITLAVRPDKRRQGLASALMASCLSHACDQGAHTLWLEVAVDNLAARGLYEALAFQIAGRRPGYYTRQGGPAVDALVMRRDLNRGDG